MCLGKYQKKKIKSKKEKKNLQKVKYVGFVLFTAELDIHKVMDIKQFSFTTSLLLYLFLGCLKHLNTNKMCSKNNESKQQVTLQIMECEPFVPLSRVNWVTTLFKGALLQL